MSENHGNIELQAGGILSPRLDLITAEYQLAHLRVTEDIIIIIIQLTLTD